MCSCSKAKRNFSQLFDLAPFSVHLNTLRTPHEFHHKNTTHGTNEFSSYMVLSFKNDADDVRIHQRRTSYKLIFLEINKINKYRRFFPHKNSSLQLSRHFLPCWRHEKQGSNFSNKQSSIFSCNVWDTESVTGLVLSYQPMKALGEWWHSSSKYSTFSTSWKLVVKFTY